MHIWTAASLRMILGLSHPTSDATSQFGTAAVLLCCPIFNVMVVNLVIAHAICRLEVSEMP